MRRPRFGEDGELEGDEGGVASAPMLTGAVEGRPPLALVPAAAAGPAEAEAADGAACVAC